ncbi:MAG: hypothetical protein PHX30_02590 [Candidatus Pacebacteria bacterium]|nr:hypothetical protein [Candidatus Paceibacterota bacterium]
MPQEEKTQSSEGGVSARGRVSGGLRDRIEDKAVNIAANQAKGGINKVASAATRKKSESTQNGMTKQAGNTGTAQNGGLVDFGNTGENARQMARLGGRDTAQNGVANQAETGNETPGSVGAINSRVNQQMMKSAGEKKPPTKEDYNKKQAEDLRMPGAEGGARRKAELQKQKDSRGEADPYQNLRNGTGGRIGTVSQSPGRPEVNSAASGVGMTEEERRKATFDEIHNKTSAQKIGSARAGAAKESGKIAEERIKGNMEVNGLKNKIALRIAISLAGDRAMRILSKAAEKMAKQAEKGGVVGAMMIGITYFVALIKDCLDFIPGAGLLTGIALGLIISVFWLSLCGSRHGMFSRWLMKLFLRAIIFFVFDGIPFFGILPLFLVMNAWNHYDYNKAVRQANETLGKINEDYMRVQKQTRKAVNSI